MRKAAIGTLVIAALIFGGCGDDGEPKPDLAGCPGDKAPKGFDTTQLVGKEVPAAQSVAKKAGLSVRVVFEDGEAQATTMDYNPQRLNVAIEDDVVVKYCFPG